MRPKQNKFKIYPILMIVSLTIMTNCSFPKTDTNLRKEEYINLLYVEFLESDFCEVVRSNYFVNANFNKVNIDKEFKSVNPNLHAKLESANLTYMLVDTIAYDYTILFYPKKLAHLNEEEYYANIKKYQNIVLSSNYCSDNLGYINGIYAVKNSKIIYDRINQESKEQFYLDVKRKFKTSLDYGLHGKVNKETAMTYFPNKKTDKWLRFNQYAKEYFNSEIALGYELVYYFPNGFFDIYHE